MKILLGITSCIKQSRAGLNQACRDTWLNRLLPDGVEYRFFMGDGTSTGEDESVAMTTVHGPLCFQNAQDLIAKELAHPVTLTHSPLPDEIMLPCPDGYFHVPWKTKKMFQWALDNGFDYTFQCCVDTWIDIPRLLSSGFERHEYSGRVCGHTGFGDWARGGTGYWVSKKAMQVITSSQVMAYCEDCSVGLALGKHGIRAFNDMRYCNPYLGETVPPSVISVHLYDSNIDTAPFTADKVRAAHARYRTEELNMSALKIDGWMSDAEARWLALQASIHRNIVEIGSWTGKSSRAMGDNTPGKLHCVDTWIGTDALNGAQPAALPGVHKIIDNVPENWVYDTFCTHMRGLLGTKVIPLRMPSLHAAVEMSGEDLDMIFIDGDHSYEGVKADINAWLPKLTPGGLICGHDWDHAAVRRAVEELLPGAHATGTGSLWQRWIDPTPPKHATVGFGWRLTWDQVKIYAHSLVRTGYAGKKLFFAADMAENVTKKLFAMGFTIIPWSFNGPGATNLAGQGVCEARWDPFLKYFSSYPLPEWIVVTDVSDVLFQANPFPWLEEKGYNLLGATQSILVGEENTHDGHARDWSWAIKAVGRDRAESIADQEVCCQGTLAGRGVHLYRYVQAINDYLKGNNDPLIMDQGYGHWLRHQPPFKDQFVVPRLSEGYVATGWSSKHSGMDPAPRVSGGKIAAGDSGKVFLIVHQWEHFPEIKALYDGSTICHNCGSKALAPDFRGLRCRMCGKRQPR